MYSGVNDVRERGKVITVFNLSQCFPEVCLYEVGLGLGLAFRVIEFRILQFRVQGLRLGCSGDRKQSDSISSRV